MVMQPTATVGGASWRPGAAAELHWAFLGDAIEASGTASDRGGSQIMSDTTSSTTPTTNRRTLLRGAAGAAAGAAALGVSKRSKAIEEPAFIRQTGSAVEVLFWSSFSANNGEQEQEVIRRFNESQQDVVIRLEFQGTYDETATKLASALQARQAPDMSLLSEANWFRFYTSEFLAPLDDLISANEVDTADYVDSFLTEGQRNGQQWWLSFARSTPLFYYNKQAWQEAGLPDRA